MAFLNPGATPPASCCSSEAQASCCEPSEKSACCGTGAAGGACGCSAGQADARVEADIRATVRERYAAAARAVAEAQPASCGCGSRGSGDARATEVFGAALYGELDADAATTTAVAASLGCGVPTEDVPLPDATVDVVISNCVINLAADKRRVLAEAARVLRRGGRFAVTDVIADPGMDDARRADMEQWTGCIAGALTEEEFRAALAAAGFGEIEVRPTHRVHEHARSAIVRARKPAPAGCCA